MGNLMTALLNTANSMRAVEQALTVTENNVVNASTPGYARQTATFEALPFDLTVGLPGGVAPGLVQSSRDAFAEQAVRNQQTDLGFYQQKVSDLTTAESFFSTSSTSGIGPAMTSFFQSFSQLSVNPNDTVSRQAVLNQAQVLAQNFQTTAAGLENQGSGIDNEARSTIASINQLAGQVATINQQNRVDPSGGVNAGVDAQLNSTLEQLSQLVNYTALQQPDGTVNIYIGGQTPLVTGGQAFAISGDFSTPQTAIISSTGADISGQITGGQLSGLLDDKNNVLPSYMQDLNTLAQSVADQVNTGLSNGIDQNGAAPSADLFTYNPATGAAVTLGVNPLTPDQIAAASPGAPGGNGNALNLAALANAKNLGNYTLAQFYGNLGGRVGNDLSTATDNQSTKQQLLNQAQTLRQQNSGVSLDQEAANLISFQRAYQANAKMLTVLDGLTDTLMNIIPSVSSG
jgi:flagellar hook-associated protein 1 FlgK